MGAWSECPQSPCRRFASQTPPTGCAQGPKCHKPACVPFRPSHICTPKCQHVRSQYRPLSLLRSGLPLWLVIRPWARPGGASTSKWQLPKHCHKAALEGVPNARTPTRPGFCSSGSQIAQSEHGVVWGYLCAILPKGSWLGILGWPSAIVLRAYQHE